MIKGLYNYKIERNDQIREDCLEGFALPFKLFGKLLFGIITLCAMLTPLYWILKSLDRRE